MKYNLFSTAVTLFTDPTVYICIYAFGWRFYPATLEVKSLDLGSPTELSESSVTVNKWSVCLSNWTLSKTLKSFMWFLSVHLSASQERRDCSFADPAFVVYSSVASFYVPFIVTLLVYAQICVVLRRRGRRTAPSRRHGLLPETGDGQRPRKVHWDCSFSRSIIMSLETAGGLW